MKPNKIYPKAMEQAQIRETAVRRVLAGESAATVTKSFGLAPKTIYRWLQVANNQGIEALAPKPRTGRNRRLTAIEELKIFNILMTSYPHQYDLEGSFWNKSNVINLVENYYHKKLSSPSALRMLYRFGYSPRQQKFELFDCNKSLYDEWCKTDFLNIKKAAQNQNAEIFWLDLFPIKDSELIESASHEADTKIHASNKNKIAMIYSAKGKFICLPYENEFKPFHILRMVKNIISHHSRPFIIITHPKHFSMLTTDNHHTKILKNYTTFYEIASAEQTDTSSETSLNSKFPSSLQFSVPEPAHRELC